MGLGQQHDAGEAGVDAGGERVEQLAHLLQAASCYRFDAQRTQCGGVSQQRRRGAAVIQLSNEVKSVHGGGLCGRALQ